MDDSIYEIRDGGGTIWKHWIVMWVPEGKRVLDKDLMDSGLVMHLIKSHPALLSLICKAQPYFLSQPPNVKNG